MNSAVTTGIPSPASRRALRKTSLRVRAGVEDALPAYTTREFLDDQRWLLRRSDVPDPFDDRVERHDGSYVVLHPATARLDLREATALFQDHLGPESGPSRLGRFLSVSRFLAENRANIVRSGLSIGDDSRAIREEFVQFLIDRYSGRHAAIPTSALTRFLDEWGHRWM